MPVLCHVDALRDNESRGFKVGQRRLVLVKKGGTFFLYENVCPHLGINLEYTEHEFLDSDKSYILCANHGALFEIDTGRCIAGPCSGQALTSVALEVKDAEVEITFDPPWNQDLMCEEAKLELGML